MNKVRHILLAALAGAAVATTAQAAPIAIVNASFEIGSTVGDGEYDFRIPTGWSAPSGSSVGYLNPSASQFPDEAPDGTYVGFANNPLEQTLTATLEANVLYTLTLAVGDSLDSLSPLYSIQLLAGDEVLASLSAGDTGGALVNGEFVTKTLTFRSDSGSAGLGEALRIRLATSSGLAYFDNLVLTATSDEPAPVPEPAALGLLGLGVLGLGVARRRRG